MAVLKKSVVIEFHGDSVMAGAIVWGGKTVQYLPSSVVAGHLLRDEFGAHIQVRNLAVGGSKLIDQFSKRMYPSGTFFDHIAQTDADIIVVNWGINDSFDEAICYHPAWFRATWEVVAAKVAERGKTLVIQTPTPMNNDHQKLLGPLVQAMRGIPGVHYIDLQQHLMTHQAGYWAQQMSDGIHPKEDLLMHIGFLQAQGLRSLMQ